MDTIGRTRVAVVLTTVLSAMFCLTAPERVDAAGLTVFWLAPPHVPFGPVTGNPKEDPFKEFEGTWLRSRPSPSNKSKEIWRVKWRGSEIEVRRAEAFDDGKRVPGKSERILIGVDIKKAGDTLIFRDSTESKGYGYYELDLSRVSDGTVYGRIKHPPQKIDLPMPDDEYFQLSRVR